MGLLLSGKGSAGELPRPVRIGVLTMAWGPPPELTAIIQGLINLGHHEAQDFIAAVWFTEGDPNALADRAQELVALGVDILVSVGPLETDAARLAAPDHPIVFLHVGDPIAQGLIATYARPGGNVTGVTDLSSATAPRRLQLFSQLIPGMRRVFHPYQAGNRYHAAEAELYRAAADRLAIELVERPLSTMDEAADVITALTPQDCDGVLAPREVGLNIPGLIIDATLRQKIPSMLDVPHYAELGGLAAYGGSPPTTGWQAARMIDLLMRGVEPAEIAAEPTFRLEFVINARVAAELGVAVPPVVLFQADRILR